MGFSPLSFTWDDVRGVARLTADLVYTDPTGAHHRVPAGFESDGASIPRFFWRVIGPPIGGAYTRPAFVHDWYYYLGTLGKAGADRLFLDSMADDGRVGWLKRNLIYWSVKFGGHKAYAKHRRQQLEESKLGIETLRNTGRTGAALPGCHTKNGNSIEPEIRSGPD